MRTILPSPETLFVRPSMPRDDAFVVELSEQAFAEFGSAAGAYVLGLTRLPQVRSWIAMRGETPVGLVVVARDAGDWSIAAIAVTPRERARGIGARLLQIAERYATSRGARKLCLMTADSNLAALDLFLRHGFRLVARRRHFYARGQDACRLEKELALLR